MVAQRRRCRRGRIRAWLVVVLLTLVSGYLRWASEGMLPSRTVENPVHQVLAAALRVGACPRVLEKALAGSWLQGSPLQVRGVGQPRHGCDATRGS